MTGAADRARPASVRRRRFVRVFLRATLLFGLLLGVAGGGATAWAVSSILRAMGIPEPRPALLFGLTVAGSGAAAGLLFTVADWLLLRRTPVERLDPIGAVRQQVTVEVPLPPDAALEAITRIVFEDLGWPIEDRAEGRLKIRRPISLRSPGEQIAVDLHPTPDGSAVLISSRPLFAFQIVDWNRNRENALLLREKIIDSVGKVRHAPQPT